MTNATERLGLRGRGLEVRRQGLERSGWSVECRWGPDDGSALSMTVKLSVSKHQAAVDAGWQLESSHLVNAEQLPGIGEETFVATARDVVGIEVKVRTGNAYAVAHVSPAIDDRPGPGDLLDEKELRAAAPAIAADMIDELVPA